MNKIEALNFGTVKDLNTRNDLQFLSDSQEVKTIKDYLGNDSILNDFDAFFVKVDNGDYSEIYAIEGIIPELNKTVWQIGIWFNWN